MDFRAYICWPMGGHPSTPAATCGGLAPSLQSKIWSAMWLMRNREPAALIECVSCNPFLDKAGEAG
jgi:hypothetical protein